MKVFSDEELEDREELAELVHKAYCMQYFIQKKIVYWTEGDYSKLSEKEKDKDRASVDAVIEGIKSIFIRKSKG